MPGQFALCCGCDLLLIACAQDLHIYHFNGWDSCEEELFDFEKYLKYTIAAKKIKTSKKPPVEPVLVELLALEDEVTNVNYFAEA